MKREKKEKPKYSILQNLKFLIEEAWRLDKETIYLPIVKEIATLALNLLELFIVPVILRTVERHTGLEELLWVIGLFTLAVVLCTGLSHYFAQLHDRAEGHLRSNLVHRINLAVCTTSYANTLDKKYRDKLRQAKRAASWPTASGQLYDMSVALFGAVAGFVIYLFLMTKVSPWLIVIVLACSVGGHFLVPNTRKANVWSYGMETETKEYTNAMFYVSGIVNENKAGKDIRLFGLDGWLRDIFNSALRKYREFVFKRERKYLAADLGSIFLMLVQNSLAYAYLIYITLEQGLAASEFLLMFTAISGFGNWINTIIETIGELHKKSLGLCHVRELFDWPETFCMEEGQEIEQPENGAYELCLENVTYSYPEAEQPVIRGVTLTIHPGEKVAVVGLNGAGKTTLVKLLCGFLDPQEGRVLLNGKDIKTFNRREYYKMFTAVFQEFSGLAASIGANVAQTEEGKDSKKIEYCLKQAGLWETVQELSDGVETPYGKEIQDEGVELSGGQKQRLMLARALYKNAPILLLDEPTAALDPLAEHDLYQKYSGFCAGKTSLFISHRLASTRFCDRILFMENGKIAEEGTHEELLAKQGGYAKLFEVQSRYYKSGEWKEEGGAPVWQE